MKMKIQSKPKANTDATLSKKNCSFTMNIVPSKQKPQIAKSPVEI